MSDLSKKAMERSLKKLLCTKTLDKITIQELTDDCGISRMTFYYHFKDIYDLVEWSFEHDLRVLLDGRPTYETWQEDYLQVFREVYRDRDILYNIYRSSGRDEIDKFLTGRTYDLIYDALQGANRKKDISPEDISFLAGFLKHAFVGLIKDWMETGMEEDPQKIVSRCSRFVESALAAAELELQ